MSSKRSSFTITKIVGGGLWKKAPQSPPNGNTRTPSKSSGKTGNRKLAKSMASNQRARDVIDGAKSGASSITARHRFRNLGHAVHVHRTALIRTWSWVRAPLASSCFTSATLRPGRGGRGGLAAAAIAELPPEPNAAAAC